MPKIAKNNIICYKVCKKHTKGIYTSLYMKFNYIIRIPYNNHIPYNKLISNTVLVYYFVDCWVLNNLGIGKNLFHSFKFITDALDSKLSMPNQAKVLKCLIPKGAYYYEDRECYASSQIKILEEIY